MQKKNNLFSNLTFDDFKRLAKDPTLSEHEKIGFPNDMRESHTHLIFDDIISKLPKVKEKGAAILDIGIGCGSLSKILINNAKELSQTFIINDSDEMLNLHNNDVIKVSGQFPYNINELGSYHSKLDAIICYSVIHYVHPTHSIFTFLDAALSLLKSGGSMLIGDIPNFSMRNRLLLSPTGIEFHKKYTQTDSIPEPLKYKEIDNEIDDAIISSIWLHYRLRGFNVFILPQADGLPMANRREDILICKL